VCDSILATGSCDRDVRVWRIADRRIESFDEVQGNASGTHAICIVGDFASAGISHGAIVVCD
jgi:hypothetical protein